MEQLARPGTTLLRAATLRLVEGYVEVKPLGAVPVKGLPEPVEIYELRRAGLVHSRLQAGVARGLTRFAGWESEFATLAQALARAGEGHGQETIPALLALLDVLPADSPFLRLDPPQRRHRTLEALRPVLLRES